MYAVRPSWLTRKLYPSAVWRIPTGEKKLFLTFDDGPVPEITPWVLQTLKSFNAKATFFCVGENIEKHPAIFRQVVSEGHSIGNHTYNHLNGWSTGTKEYLSNVSQFTGAAHTTLFRPPYGRMRPSQYSILNTQYALIMWDVLSGDFDQSTSEEECLRNVITKARPGSIIVFHDSVKAKKNLYYALPKALQHFAKEGYSCEALSPSLRVLGKHPAHDAGETSKK